MHSLNSIIPLSAPVRDRLARLGIFNTTDLLVRGATPAMRRDLAHALRCSVDKVALWVSMAGFLQIRSVGPQRAHLLVEATGAKCVQDFLLLIDSSGSDKNGSMIRKTNGVNTWQALTSRINSAATKLNYPKLSDNALLNIVAAARQVRPTIVVDSVSEAKRFGRKLFRATGKSNKEQFKEIFFDYFFLLVIFLVMAVGIHLILQNGLRFPETSNESLNSHGRSLVSSFSFYLEPISKMKK
jgi:hypothetical protein